MSTKSFRPSYLGLGVARLRERAEKAREMLSPCRICPRECGVDRIGGEAGFCKTLTHPLVSSRNLHHGEEPPISGYRGSGTIFFSNCNLRCVFCQNYPISQMGHGNEISCRELARSMIELQDRGAHNINFVTPSHVVAAILETMVYAVEGGLKIPLVWNSSGYDSVETLKLLDGVVDIYLPDMKYADNENAVKYSHAPNYVAINRAAVREMRRQVGALRMDAEGVAERGLLIRHLVLPGGGAGSEEILRFIAEELSPETYISLMSQYFPANKAHQFPDMERGITSVEYVRALNALHRFGLENGFIQEE